MDEYEKIRSLRHSRQSQCRKRGATNKDAECWLMAIDGTSDGRICECAPVHKLGESA